MTPKETHLWLKDFFDRNPEIGFRKAAVNIAFYPATPFKPKERRLPKPGFLFGALLFSFTVAWFFVFNFVR